MCIHSRLIAGRKDTQEGKQTVFFAALDPVSDVEKEYQDVSKPRKAHYKSKWALIQDAICCINLREAQDKGLQFWQTPSNATILCDSVPADCIERVIIPKLKRFRKKAPLSPRPKLLCGALCRFNAKLLISAAPVRGESWRTRKRRSLRLTFARCPCFPHVLQVSSLYQQSFL